MVKQARKKTKPPQKLHGYLTRPKLLGAALLLVVLLVGGYFLNEVRLDAADKQKFETVRQSMEALQRRLQAAATDGEQWRVYVSCSEGNVKYAEGLKVCEVGLRADTAVAEEVQINRAMKKYQTIFEEANSYFTLSRPFERKPTIFPSNMMSGYAGAGFREKKTSMTCGSFFELGNLRQRKDSPRSVQYSLALSFSCSDRARKLHYPNANSQ